MSSITSTIKLPNGMDMPLLGLGTLWVKSKDEVKVAIKAALDVGYRSIDTALAYANEEAIGETLSELFQAGKYVRNDIFITTKIIGSFFGSEEHMRRALNKSLTALKLDFIDLYLLHGPIGYKLNANEDPIPVGEDGEAIFANHDIIKTWQVMEKFVAEGQVKAIGVSNFNAKQITRIQEVAKVPIATNQVECHVYFQQRQLRKFCKEHGIPITAYAPLGSPAWAEKPPPDTEWPILLKDSTVLEIAEKYKKSAAQILLRYLLDSELIIIPRSRNPNRIKENAELYDFELSSGDRHKLDGLDRNVRYFTFQIWFGDVFANCGVGHPEYPFSDPF